MASTITILVFAVLLAASGVFREVESLSDAEAYDLLVPLNALFYDLYEKEDYDAMVERLYCPDVTVRVEEASE